jgi:hypothetical protein
MRKAFRRWYWWLPALILAAAAGYVGYRATYPPWAKREAWAKYQGVQLGMTFEEAEEVLGGEGYEGNWTYPLGGGMHFWEFNGDFITLSVEPSGMVRYKKVVVQDHEFSDPPRQPHW